MNFAVVAALCIISALCMVYAKSCADCSGSLRGFAGVRRGSAAVASHPLVDLRCGSARGTWERGLAAFRGIPYGRPPIGDLRWKPAAPADCWSPNVLNATRNGFICYQGGGPGQSENCLNLNVFVPAAHFTERTHGYGARASLPVLVWIYGGGNYEGSVLSYGEIENIARKKDLILVAMNYRLNIFGYLALQELAEVDPRGVSGNYGITDQQLALRWVQENIASFGGNARNVTIMGHSSGATNVHAHLASTSSRGLFHKAISLSGSSNLTMDRGRKELQDRKLVLDPSPCGQADGILSCLYGLSTHDLYSLLPTSYMAWSPLYDYPVDSHGLRVSALPYVDGVTVTHALEVALAEGLNDVPVLFQGMQAEMDCYPDKDAEALTETTLLSLYEQKFSSGYSASMPSEVYRIYRQHEDPVLAAYAVDADTAVSCGLRSLALAAKDGYTAPVFWGAVVASPSHPFHMNMSSLPSRYPFHGWDVNVVVEHWGSYSPTVDDKRLGSILLDQWFELMSSGNLASKHWQRVQDASGNLVFGSRIEKSVIRPLLDMKKEECTFWASHGIASNWRWIN